MNWIPIGMWILILTGEPLYAQLLPQGVGLYRYGHRTYAPTTHEYGPNGNATALGQKFSKDFTGREISAGGGGDDLKELGQELERYGSGSSGDVLADELYLGSLRADVEAQVRAQIFAVAFGFTSRTTGFLAVPFISARTQTKMRLEGGNNAADIKKKLGDLAYEDLKDGLDQAGAMNLGQIKQSIYDKGYAFDNWERDGMGDVRLGATTSVFRSRLRKGVATEGLVTITSILPTGYTESTDHLTDLSFGTGYYSQKLDWEQQLILGRRVTASLLAGYGKNFDTTQEKRVPEADESLVEPERKQSVQMDPGDDTHLGLSLKSQFTTLGFALGTGRLQHFGDRYRGKLQGNYTKLSEGSDQTTLYRSLEASYRTTELYKKNTFPVPFIAELAYYETYAGLNIPRQHYYEFRLTSFFKP